MRAPRVGVTVKGSRDVRCRVRVERCLSSQADRGVIAKRTSAATNFVTDVLHSSLTLAVYMADIEMQTIVCKRFLQEPQGE